VYWPNFTTLRSKSTTEYLWILPFFNSLRCGVLHAARQARNTFFMKPLFAGMIFVVTALIAFSEVAPSVDGRPALERAIHDLIVDIHLR
jgi:hypothetical protein